MLKSWARMPFFVLLIAAVALATPSKQELVAPRRVPVNTAPQNTVYLARNLSSDNLLVLSAALAAREPSAVLLLDSPTSSSANRAFLNQYQPQRIVPVGDFDEDRAALAERLGMKPELPYPWTQRPPLSVWRSLFPRAESVIVCPPLPGLLLQATCLAGTLDIPLYVYQDNIAQEDELRHLLAAWQTSHVYALGGIQLPSAANGLDVTTLVGEREVSALHRQLLAAKGPIRTVIVANAHDRKADKITPSIFAPWLALQHRAVLTLTNKEGSDADARVTEVIQQRGVEKAETLIVAADIDDIPVHKRPNPIKGDKDTNIDMEPMTPEGDAPFSFAVGRIYHPDPGIIPLMISRPRLLAKRTGPRKAIVVSNPSGGLPLLEAISRQTVRELRNSGFETTAYFGKTINRDELRKQMPLNDIFVWEGHHNQLVLDWEFPSWEEPLPPSLIFLQSCLALREWKVAPLFRRGAVGVIASSTRTYSASGGATSLAFFGAVIHEDRPVGEALRQSKNFMLAYYLLKQKRLDDVKKAGANLRAAWAFTLWGDPTVRLPKPEAPRSQNAVRHVVKGNTITFQMPPEKLGEVRSEKYRAEVFANSRLAGLLGKEKDEDNRTLQPMVFAEVELPQVPDGKKPRLSSRLPSRNWVFTWDARLKRGYVLAVPRSKDTQELRFSLRWDDDGMMSYADE